jgi:pyroglutamyl-peptidase
MPNVLLTGFEPFDGERINPSGEIARALEGEIVRGHRIATAIVPVAFAAMLPKFEALLDEHRPVLAIATGQAGGRSELAIERIAANLVDARIPDADGAQPIDVRVIDDAPDAYFSTLPVKAMLERMRALGIPAALSQTAGAYVCNYAFFALAHLVATKHRRTRAGFVHVPWLPEQAARHAGQPSMALETMVHGVRAAIDAALSTQADRRFAGGETH